MHTIADGTRALVTNTFGRKIEALAFQPGGRWLVALDAAGAISIVDQDTQVEILRLNEEHAGNGVQRLEFDATGKRLFVARGGELEFVSTDPDDWAKLAERIAK